MLVGLGWEHGCFYSWAFFLLLGAAIGSSAHFGSAFYSASLRLVSRAAPPSQLKPPRADQLSWGGSASLCLFNLHSVGTTAISACCFWGVGADWMDYESVSRVFLAWLVRWNGCPWKKSPISFTISRFPCLDFDLEKVHFTRYAFWGHLLENGDMTARQLTQNHIPRFILENIVIFSPGLKNI